MSCGTIDPGNTFLWITLGGVLSGGGLSFLLCPSKRRRGAFFAVFLSIAILSLLISLYVYDFSIADPAFRLYWLAACIAVGYAGFLFWKFLGIPLFFLTVIFISGSWYGLYGFGCAYHGTEICSLRIISEGENFRRIQYDTGNDTEIIELIEGDLFYPELDVIQAPEYFFILRTPVIYRFNGFSSEGYVYEPSGANFITRTIMKLPGFEAADRGTAGFKAAPSLDYSLKFDSDEKIKLIRQIE